MTTFPFTPDAVFEPLVSLRENPLYQKSAWAEIPALKLRLQNCQGIYFGEDALSHKAGTEKLPADKREYTEFERLYAALDGKQKERAREIVQNFVGATVRMIEPGLMHNAKMHARDIWDYYLERGTLPPDIQFPHYKWLDTVENSKKARFERVLKHLRDPSASAITEDSVQPCHWQSASWKFEDVDTVYMPDKNVYALPYPHELSAGSDTFVLRKVLRDEIKQSDDTAVIQAVMAHPDIRDVVAVCEYYSGLCDGEQERHYSARATETINKTAERIKSGELSGFPNGTEQFAVLTEEMRRMPDVLREKYFGLGQDFDMYNIGKAAMAKAVTAIRADALPELSKTERLALFAGLLGKYSSIGSYVDYGMRETALIEKWSKSEILDEPGYRFDGGKWMVFSGAGSLPMSAIMEHIITGTPCLLVDVEEHALLKAQNLVHALERFGIVQPGQVLCAPPCSAEDFFTLTPSFTRVTNDAEGNRHRLSEHRDWLKKIGVLHIAALIPDTVKYEVARSIGKLSSELQPDMMLSRTVFGKSMLVHPKTLRYPICQSMTYAGSSAAHVASDAEDHWDEKSRRMLDVPGAENPPAAISSAHIFRKKKGLPIVPNTPAPKTWSNAIDGEIELDPSFETVIGQGRLAKLRECTQHTSMFPLDVHMSGKRSNNSFEPWWKTHHNLVGILAGDKPQAYSPMPEEIRYPVQLGVFRATHG